MIRSLYHVTTNSEWSRLQVGDVVNLRPSVCNDGTGVFFCLDNPDIRVVDSVSRGNQPTAIIAINHDCDVISLRKKYWVQKNCHRRDGKSRIIRTLGNSVSGVVVDIGNHGDLPVYTIIDRP